jgi:biopolymer transport protein ExbD
MAGTTHLGGGGPAGDVAFNYIPLIDVTFNLIIFFILTSEISGAQSARVMLPDPHTPQAVERAAMSKNNVTIAVVSQAAYENNKDAVTPETAARAYKYEIDGQEFDITNLDLLVAKIQQKKDFNSKLPGNQGPEAEFFVEIRADSRVAFSEVTPVIMAIAKAKIAKMAISAKSAGAK